MLGIEKIIILFNKMDRVEYNQERFQDVKSSLEQFMQRLGVRPSFMIPVSAKEGDNVSKRSSRMRWYKGPTLFEVLDSIKLERRLEKKPLRFPIQDIYELDSKKIVVGKVVSGVIKKGQDALYFPSVIKARVEAIETFGGKKAIAQVEENIGLLLSDVTPAKRGEVIASKEGAPRSVSQFKGNIFWMSEEPLEVGRRVTLRCSTQEVTSTVEKIERRINSSTLELIEEKAHELKINEAAIVTFKTERPIVIEKFSFIEELGRFVIERDYNLEGAGIIPKEASE
jgi:sulfate adenylyltransferase subunit 1 (EFTu-like GTPase family)